MAKKSFSERFVRWTARCAAKGTVGIGYAALRGVYRLGDLGEIFAEEFSQEVERLHAHHEASVARQQALHAKFMAERNARNAAPETVAAE